MHNIPHNAVYQEIFTSFAHLKFLSSEFFLSCVNDYMEPMATITTRVKINIISVIKG